MHYLESVLRVLVVGLLLGAGLPALFAAGILSYCNGRGGVDDEGTVHAPNPALKFLGLALFVFVAAVIVVAILWITRPMVVHHLGIDLFPFLPRK